MNRNPDATCENCPYFWFSSERNIDGDPYAGQCRKYASRGTATEFFYSVPSDGWCGEHPDFEEKPPFFRSYHCTHCNEVTRVQIRPF